VVEAMQPQPAGAASVPGMIEMGDSLLARTGAPRRAQAEALFANSKGRVTASPNPPDGLK